MRSKEKDGRRRKTRKLTICQQVHVSRTRMGLDANGATPFYETTVRHVTQGGPTETGEQAVRVFGFSQDLSARRPTADTATRRLLLDIVCSNLRLNGQTLVPTPREPFDFLAAGLLGPTAGNGRGERI